MAKIPHRKYYGMKRSEFACPESRHYPLTDAAHVRNAMARWNNPRTKVHCRGGLRRICRAAEKFGIASRSCRISGEPYLTRAQHRRVKHRAKK